jgi:hypothetical protein
LKHKYDLRLDFATVDLHDLTKGEMARTRHHVMLSKVENKHLVPGEQSDLKPPSVFDGYDRDLHNWNTELQSYLGVLPNAD